MLSEGQSFDRYRIETVLGQGGMGTVYRAHDERLDRSVALKVLAVDGDGTMTDAELRARLMREGRAAAKLDHPNAVVVYDVGEVEKTPFIAMELVEGRTLREVLQSGTPLRDDAVRWLDGVALALGHAHERGIVHRDVKPENVMVRPDGRIKVLDFGIARRLAGPVDPGGPTASPALPTLTVEGTLLGTTRYMSPEQIRGLPLDGRSDQFAWGAMAYELLSGRLPWSGSDALAISASVLTDTPPSLVEAGVPPGIARVVERALQKNPEKRFESMQAAAEALERAASGKAPADQAPGDKRAAQAPAAAHAGRDLRSFSTEQVSEILKRAVDVQASRASGMSHEELAEVAAEVGVDRAALDQAVRDLDRPRAVDPRKAQLERLRNEAIRYAGIAVMLLFVAALTDGWHWFWWALFGLVAVLVSRGSRVLRGEESRGDRRRARRRELRRRRDDPEIQRGVDLLLEATSRRRMRVDERVRVAQEEEEPAEVEPAVAARERVQYKS